MLQGFISPAGSWNEVVLFGSLALRAKVCTPSLGRLSGPRSGLKMCRMLSISSQ